MTSRITPGVGANLLGQHTAERNQDATAYVGNLDAQVTEELLWELFVQAGPVVNVYVPKDRVTGLHQGYGFVEFRSEEDADYAIKILNMIKLYGKPIRVNKASQDKKSLDVGANLFVGNLDPDVDEKLLYDTFSAFGVIVTNPKIMRDPDTGNSRGFGFVSYDSFETSDAAIEAMNGQYLCNRQITVSYAYKKDTKGERHGTPAERMLAASNPGSQRNRPHTLFASGPPTLPNGPQQANGNMGPPMPPPPFGNGPLQHGQMPSSQPPQPQGGSFPPPMQASRPPPPWSNQPQQQGHGMPPPGGMPPQQFRPPPRPPPPNGLPVKPEGKQVHVVIIRSGFECNVFLGSSLVDMYAKSGAILDARQVFDEMSHRNVVSWTAMITGYAQCGKERKALTLFGKMDQAGMKPNQFTFASILKVCASPPALKRGKQIHARIIRNGLVSNVFLGSAIVDMYSKCGTVENARTVFDEHQRDVVSWNGMIAGYVQQGRGNEALALLAQMLREGMKPNHFTFASILRACGGLAALEQSKQAHAHLIISGLKSDIVLGSALVDVYAKCGDIKRLDKCLTKCLKEILSHGHVCKMLRRIEVAHQLFDKMCQRDLVSWNAMIAGYSQSKHSSKALGLFHQMQLADVIPNIITILSLLSACLHLQQGYAHNGFAHEALKLSHEMQLVERKADSVTMVSLLPSCAHLTALHQGKWIHAYIIRNGFDSDLSVLNALIDMYAKCRNIEVSCHLFNKMYKRDVISWSAMIAGYGQNGLAIEALSLFYQMQMANIKPNQVTVLSVLQACAGLAALQQGKKIHDLIIKTGLESDVSVGTALVTMYAKCRSIKLAKQLFDKMSESDVILWSAMIMGYAQNGLANEALELFHQMWLSGMKPNLVTILSVLPACADLAALQQGNDIHGYIIKNGFESDISVGTALVDMYAKCGRIDVAHKIFDEMSKRDIATWNTMIGGYGMHGLGEDALALFSQMQQMGMKPDHITFICVLSACSHRGLVDEGRHYFDCMSQDYCILPRVEHYACMVDLLGRAGHLDEAQDFIKKMPFEPDAGLWGSLFVACRIHGNIELGEHAAESLLVLEPNNARNYVLLSNIYAAAGRWDDVANVRIMLKNSGLKKIPACSWIEIKNKVHVFQAGDRSHPQSEKILAVLHRLAGQMEDVGYVPDTSLLGHNVEEEKEYSL